MGAQATPFFGGSYAQDPALQAYSRMDPTYGQFIGSGAADAGVPFDMWRWLGSNGGGGGRGGQKMVPTVAPSAMQGQPQGGSQGLMPQNSMWNMVYGQQAVPRNYMDRINRRFGFDPTGVGYAADFDPSRPQWYQPPTVYPQTSFPSLVR